MGTCEEVVGVSGIGEKVDSRGGGEILVFVVGGGDRGGERDE